MSTPTLLGSNNGALSSQVGSGSKRAINSTETRSKSEEPQKSSKGGSREYMLGKYDGDGTVRDIDATAEKDSGSPAKRTRDESNGKRSSSSPSVAFQVQQGGGSNTSESSGGSRGQSRGVEKEKSKENDGGRGGRGKGENGDGERKEKRKKEEKERSGEDLSGRKKQERHRRKEGGDADNDGGDDGSEKEKKKHRHRHHHHGKHRHKSKDRGEDDKKRVPKLVEIEETRESVISRDDGGGSRDDVRGSTELVPRSDKAKGSVSRLRELNASNARGSSEWRGSGDIVKSMESVRSDGDDFAPNNENMEYQSRDIPRSRDIDDEEDEAPYHGTRDVRMDDNNGDHASSRPRYHQDESYESMEHNRRDESDGNENDDYQPNEEEYDQSRSLSRGMESDEQQGTRDHQYPAEEYRPINQGYRQQQEYDSNEHSDYGNYQNAQRNARHGNNAGFGDLESQHSFDNQDQDFDYGHGHERQPSNQRHQQQPQRHEEYEQNEEYEDSHHDNHEHHNPFMDHLRHDAAVFKGFMHNMKEKITHSFKKNHHNHEEDYNGGDEEQNFDGRGEYDEHHGDRHSYNEEHHQHAHRGSTNDHDPAELKNPFVGQNEHEGEDDHFDEMEAGGDRGIDFSHKESHEENGEGDETSRGLFKKTKKLEPPVPAIQTIPLETDNVIIRTLDKRRFISLYDNEDAEGFDAILQWKMHHPNKTRDDAWKHFCPLYRSADALVGILFGVNQWDYIIRTKKTSDQTIIRARQSFEKSLCRKGLILEIEESFERNHVIFIKVLLPFYVLCREARLLKLRLPIKNTVKPLPDEALLNNSQKEGIHDGVYHLDLNKQTAILDSDDVSNFQFKMRQPNGSFRLVPVEGQSAHIIRTMFFEARHRILIAFKIITSTEIRVMTNKGLRSEGIERLIAEKVYLDFYPTHEPSDAQDGLKVTHRDRFSDSVSDLFNYFKKRIRGNSNSETKMKEDEPLQTTGSEGPYLPHHSLFHMGGPQKIVPDDHPYPEIQHTAKVDSHEHHEFGKDGQPKKEGERGLFGHKEHDHEKGHEHHPGTFHKDHGHHDDEKVLSEKGTTHNEHEHGHSGHEHNVQIDEVVNEGKQDKKSKLAKGKKVDGMKLPLSLRGLLIRDFVNSKSLVQYPLDLMRDYFGEKVAFYFVYLDFYNTWLMISSIFGVITFIVGIVSVATTNQDFSTNWRRLFDNALSPYFGLAMSLWSVLYLEFWKRRNSFYAYKWSVNGCETIESRRLDFTPTGQRRSPVTGKLELIFPEHLRTRRKVFSSLIVIPFVGLVFTTVIAQIAFIGWLRSSYDVPEEQTALAASFVGLASVQLCRYIFRPIARALTDYENYKTDSAYERALVLKMWCFEFVNIYSHIGYFAFIRPFLTSDKILGFEQDHAQCTVETCGADVSLELLIIFLGDQALERLSEVLIPLIMKKFRQFKTNVRQIGELDRRKRPQHYKDEKMTANEGLDEDYLQKAIQYGYVTMFVTAFPLAPVFALLNNVVEVKTDSYKMLKVLRRPTPFIAEDIGLWQDVLQACSLIAVTTNGFLVAFTSNNFFVNYVQSHDPASWTTIRLSFLIGWHAVVYLIGYAFMLAVPDQAEIVRVAMERADYLEKIAIDPNAEAEDETMEVEAHSIVDLTKA
ncbi:hypothetical protein HDU76_010474 [Blyttiomyces sp. JEL0837]|nr:hypothetical protein HDU76_010474 [Blyttiomyces sp. JEL0837]